MEMLELVSSQARAGCTRPRITPEAADVVGGGQGPAGRDRALAAGGRPRGHRGRRLRRPRRLDRAPHPNPGRGLPALRGAGGAAHLLQRHRPLLGRAANERRERRGPRSRRSAAGSAWSPTARAPSAWRASSATPTRPAPGTATPTSAPAIPSLRPTPPSEPWSFRATDLDIAGHVNNTHYWAPIEQEFLTEGEPEAFDGEVEHREPAQPGPATLLSAGPMRWVTSPSGALHASIHRA